MKGGAFAKTNGVLKMFHVIKEKDNTNFGLVWSVEYTTVNNNEADRPARDIVDFGVRQENLGTNNCRRISKLGRDSY
jgi:hypothetical protein